MGKKTEAWRAIWGTLAEVLALPENTAATLELIFRFVSKVGEGRFIAARLG